MRRYLRQRRMDDRIEALRRQLAETDRERVPLDAARLTRDLADLYADSGNRVEAVRWYGQSIDAYIYAGFTDAAVALCRKVIRYEPRVIRARGTLAMLLLTQRDHEAAVEEIREYVAVTRERGVGLELTRERLRALAELAEAPEVRSLIGQSLIELGATDLGREMLPEMKRMDSRALTPG